MKHAPDMQNPITDQWASALYSLTPLSVVGLEGRHEVWENADPIVRDVFRDRARRMLAGDLSVEPWRVTRMA